MTDSPSRADVVIVGAGMAGLTAAGDLARAGGSAIVLDKGRAPGGRMATRTIDGIRFDHGAQQFSARSGQFEASVAQLRDAGVVSEWFRSSTRTGSDGRGEARLAGVGGMRRIPEHLARGLDVRTSLAIDRLEMTADETTAMVGNHAIARGAGIILTPPVPQTVALLEASDVYLGTAAGERLGNVEYNATLAVMATLDAPSELPDGHLAQPAEHVAWIADNQHKGVSELPAVTIHSTADFAASHLDGDPARWTRELCEQVQDRLAGAIVAATGHRWRYAEPTTTFDIGSVAVAADRPIVLAGEVFAGAKVEGAFLSGRAAAEQMLALL